MTRASDTARLIGAGATIEDGTTISTDDNTAQLTLKSTDADASTGPLLVLNRDSASPADGDVLGVLQFKGDDDAGNSRSYVQVQTKINDASNSTLDGEMEILTLVGDNSRSRIELLPSETVFNEDGVDIDFRVESDINANAMFLQASDGRIGFNTVPDSNRRFHIKSDQNDAFIQMIEMTGTGNKFGFDVFTSATQNNDNNSEFIRCRDTGAVRFRVMSDGDVQNDDNSYGSTSDVKLKEQITDASSQWDDIKALTVRKYKMKEDVAKGDSDAHWRLGVVAQELETAGMNGLVKDNPDLVEDDNGFFVDSGTVTKSVKYSILYMKAVKALQEAMARIETLEAKVTSLENA